MQQVISDFTIKLVNYTNKETFPFYADDKNAPIIKTTQIINDLSFYNVTSGILVLPPDTNNTFIKTKYLYLKESNNLSFTINDTFISSEFLFNNITSMSTIGQDFTISNHNSDSSIRLEYYLLTSNE